MSHTEKRRFARFPLEARVTFTLNDDQDMLYQGTSQNLCAGGVYITTNHLAKLGEQIKLIIASPENDDEPFILEGRIVRSKFDKTNTELFHVSIEFTEAHEDWVQDRIEETVFIPN